jgi:hypothetical protein
MELLTGMQQGRAVDACRESVLPAAAAGMPQAPILAACRSSASWRS